MGTEMRDRGAVEVARALESLKRSGGNILFVGTAASRAHGEVCDRLCADAGGERRYHLFVTDDLLQIDVPAQRNFSTSQTIDYGSIALTQPSSGATLETFSLEVIEAIDELESEAGGFEPSELRVCVGSLATLFQEYQTEQVFRFVHMIRSRIDQAQGIAHYHLPVRRDHDAVGLLEPIFDATVELRRRNQMTEQRWHIHNHDVSTDWIEL